MADSRRTRRAGAAALLAAVALFAGAAAAQLGVPPPPSPPRLVNDYAGLLARSERDALERKLVAFDDSTSTQIAVVVFRTLDGADPAMFATELGHAWGVGGAAGDNGIVLLVAVDDRDVFIATGQGVEGAVPDAIAARIVRDIIVPAFRGGRFYAGIDAATDALIAATRGEFSAAPTSGGGVLPVELIVIIVLVAVVLISMWSDRGDPDGRGRRRRGGHFVPWFIPTGGWSSGGSSGWSSGGSWSGGGGGFRCGHGSGCGFRCGPGPGSGCGGRVASAGPGLGAARRPRGRG